MKRIPIICLAFFGSLAICSLGCSRAASSSKSASPSRPPVQVDVAKAEEESIIDYREFTGRVAAINSVEVRARVSGYLLQSPISRLAKEIGQDKALGDGTSSNQWQVRAREGALVQNGTLLFKSLVRRICGSFLARKGRQGCDTVRFRRLLAS